MLATPSAAQTVRAETLSTGARDSIVQLAQIADERWNAKDAAGMSEVYTADAHNLIVGTAADLRGQAAIRAFFEQSFAARRAGVRHRTVVGELQPVAPGVVWTDSEVWVERAEADGTVTPLRRFTAHAVAVRTPAGWRIRLNRVHPVQLAG